MNFKNYDEMIILMFAFRYALLRQTIASASVGDFILKNKDKIPKGWLKKMQSECESEVEKAKSLEFKKCYSDCDVEFWDNFSKELKK